MTIFLRPVAMSDFRELGLPLPTRDELERAVGFALVQGDKTVAIGGLTRDRREGVGKAWAWMNEAKKSPFLMRKIHGYVKELLPQIRDELKFERVEADCINVMSHCRWLDRLGFTFEGYSKKFMNKRTYARYSWIRPD